MNVIPNHETTRSAGKLMSREYADSSGLPTKVRINSGLSIRADHTALFGSLEPETQFETPNAVSPSVPRSLLEHSVLFTPSRSGAPPTFHYTG
ncbi:hypothetical protein AVEN_46919-1 [Araneus ventricosus]|uniref:Uncharacterized protein n=1 Tax=Araneus ventricosus TaxID=182803 RepID=A0A4Y2RU33_ARAVE|nr:hypothetical protein AVEN_47583-1 [Araneus ventricosus]GBN78886.1 hypothetical protein AVEN_46919-1 [Araneus ventricosus]